MPRAVVPVTAMAAVATRPWLWPAVIRLVPSRWWRRWPPLPLPPSDYLRFRIQTMYGERGAPIDKEDLIAYLEWCRRVAPRAR
jgi:hypothetical protein